MNDRPHRPRSRAEWQPFNAQVIEDFRSNAGRVDRFGDLRLMILHTIGARTGAVREVPLFIVEHESGMLVYGTAEGSPQDPGWVHNLRANPDIVVELGGGAYRATFEELDPAAASEIIDAHAAETPLLATYVESAAPRPIPVFRIHLEASSEHPRRPA